MTYKGKMWNSQKIKECKKRYHKIAQLRKVLALYCYCGNKVKFGLLSKHLIQRKLHKDAEKITK